MFVRWCHTSTNLGHLAEEVDHVRITHAMCQDHNGSVVVNLIGFLHQVLQCCHVPLPHYRMGRVPKERQCNQE